MIDGGKHRVSLVTAVLAFVELGEVEARPGIVGSLGNRARQRLLSFRVATRCDEQGGERNGGFCHCRVEVERGAERRLRRVELRLRDVQRTEIEAGRRVGGRHLDRIDQRDRRVVETA